jgi:hypothetical protein
MIHTGRFFVLIPLEVVGKNIYLLFSINHHNLTRYREIHMYNIYNIQFRTANHKLPIEIGRWNNTNRNNRICTHCNKNELGDEFHYIFTPHQIFPDPLFLFTLYFIIIIITIFTFILSKVAYIR